MIHAAGKDRTGVLASIILSLAGASDAAIAKDYALTRIGIEPVKEFLLQFFTKSNPQWTEETPGVREFFAIKESYMLAFLDAVRKEYGGMEEYVKSRLEFSEEDIEKIRYKLKGV
jgi:protein tyrosine/serine phosphatase